MIEFLNSNAGGFVLGLVSGAALLAISYGANDFVDGFKRGYRRTRYGK